MASGNRAASRSMALKRVQGRRRRAQRGPDHSHNLVLVVSVVPNSAFARQPCRRLQERAGPSRPTQLSDWSAEYVGAYERPQAWEQRQQQASRGGPGTSGSAADADSFEEVSECGASKQLQLGLRLAPQRNETYPNGHTSMCIPGTPTCVAVFKGPVGVG